MFMEQKPMKLLIVEDDIKDCNNFIECAKMRNDIEIVAITDSDVDAIKYLKAKRPEGIILDFELNNSKTGSQDAFGFLKNLKELRLNYDPIIIVTTHVNAKTTYDLLHRCGVNLILYKDHNTYSCNSVFNKFLTFRNVCDTPVGESIEEILKDEEKSLSECINHELDLVGITAKLKGRKYIHDAIMYLIQNEGTDENVIKYLSKIHHRGTSTISNGIENAIIHGWRVSAVEDLEKYYTATINANSGIPTPMELIYYYVEKVKRLV